MTELRSSLSVRVGAVCGNTDAHCMVVPDNPTQADVDALLEELLFFVTLQGRSYYWADQWHNTLTSYTSEAIDSILAIAT